MQPDVAMFQRLRIGSRVEAWKSYKSGLRAQYVQYKQMLSQASFAGRFVVEGGLCPLDVANVHDVDGLGTPLYSNFVFDVSPALLAARFAASPCCDLCGLTLGECCHRFQFFVLLLDAAMLELRVRVGALLYDHESLTFRLGELSFPRLAGRTQSKEGSKTLVLKGERSVKVFSQASCFESVFLRASGVALGVFQQPCSCVDNPPPPPSPLHFSS